MLVVDKRADVDLGDLGDLVEREHVFHVYVEGRLAHCIQVLADFNFLLSHAIELLIVQAYVHSIVNVGPLGSVIDLVTIVGISRHKVASLDEVIKDELLLQCSVVTLGPSGTQSTQCL